MSNKNMISGILVGLILVGCSKITPSTPSMQPTIFSTPTPLIATSTEAPPSPMMLPSATLIPLPPTQTSSPIPSPLPTNTFTPSITPISWGETPLSAENASSIIQKGVWGLGSPQDSAFSSSANVYVQGTPIGIYLYQANDLQLIRFIPESHEFFLSHAGDLLFTRVSDGSIKVIDLPSGEDKYVFSPIAVLSPLMKDTVYEQLPGDRPALEKQYFDQVSTMRTLAVSDDGNLVSIGFGDASIGLWDLQSGTLVSQLKNDIVQDVSELVFSPNGEKLLSTGNGGDIAVWQVDDGQLLWRLPHVGHIIGQPFSMDGSLVAVEITQETSSWVAVRETRYGGELAPQVVGKVASQAISPDNKRLVTTWYGAVKIWSLPNLILQKKIETGLDWPQASFSTDGNYLLINAGEQAYHMSDLSLDESYQAAIPQPTQEVNTESLLQIGHLPGIIGLRFPQSGQAFAWGILSNHEAWVWDLSNNVKTIYDFGSAFYNWSEPDLSFTGDRLTACTDDGLEVIALTDGQKKNFGACRPRAPSVVRFSVDGATLFRTNGVFIDALNSNTGELLYDLVWHSRVVNDIAITPDGAYLVSKACKGTGKCEVIWWRIDNPKKLWMWIVYSGGNAISSAAVQEEDQVLYTSLAGLRSWRLGDGQPDHLDTNDIVCLALSPQNHLLATGDSNGGIHIWSLDNWQELAIVSGHKLGIVGLAFSQNGANLLSISTDGTIRLWGLP